MNLLEHYIINIIEEKDVGDGWLEVTFLGDCWGESRKYKATVRKEDWEIALSKGYILL